MIATATIDGFALRVRLYQRSLTVDAPTLPTLFVQRARAELLNVLQQATAGQYFPTNNDWNKYVASALLLKVIDPEPEPEPTYDPDVIY